MCGEKCTSDQRISEYPFKISASQLASSGASSFPILLWLLAPFDLTCRKTRSDVKYHGVDTFKAWAEVCKSAARGWFKTCPSCIA